MSNQPTATASATVAFPVATIAVVFLWIAKVQNLWGLGDISWWLVFAPYWLGFAVFLVILLGILVVAGIVIGVGTLWDNHETKKRRKRQAALAAKREAERQAMRDNRR